MIFPRYPSSTFAFHIESSLSLYFLLLLMIQDQKLLDAMEKFFSSVQMTESL